MTDHIRSSASGFPIVQGIQLVSTHNLPDRLRSIFKFPAFNPIQSKCFHTVFNTNDNFILSAPTGSGKTAVLELAICRLIAQRGFNCDFKVVYQAPTKSLCAERKKDWELRFSHLNLKCAELTGDTEQSHLRSVVKNADIIITTPEKWDSMTRKWKDHVKLVNLVKLFLIDEVHILNEDRGASLEAVVSRMKSMGSDVRFVALSATVPNSEDIASWLGKSSRMQNLPAAREVFGEEFRPVRLKKYVVPIEGTGANDFAVENLCTQQLPNIISTYGKERKPIMIFCFTKPSAERTAKMLADWWKASSQQYRYWTAMPTGTKVGNAALAECIKFGVAFHHAGLDVRDRATVEKAYLDGSINVICCTSTLAVGVNLPCHFVIIKNTVGWQGEGCKEYSDLDIMQMLGRAGRPQFDTTGVAVIMTRREKVDRYEKMVSGQEVLESRLHENLIDHLNAEIGLGTIYDDESARTWLEGTFFFVRFSKNPEKYRLEGARKGQSVDEIISNVCNKDLKLLAEYSLLTVHNDTFKPSELGDAMARYYVHFDTMKLILSLQPKPRLSEILSAIAQASEFKSIRFRPGEKPLFKQINDSPSIKFPIQVDIAMSAHKVSLYIQAILGGIDLRDNNRFGAHAIQFSSESALVFQHVHRLVRCIIDCQLYKEDSIGVRHALDLARSLGARGWDDTPLQLLQIEQIGPVAVRKLVTHDIKSIEDLENTDAQHIDYYLSKNPPFGANLLQKLKDFPKLRVVLKMMGKAEARGTEQSKCVQVHVKAELGFINETPPVYFLRKAVHVILLAETSDGRKIHFYRTSGKLLGRGQDVLFTANLTSPKQFINCYVSCDEIAGTLKEATLNPKIPASMFPIETPVEVDRPISKATTSAPAPRRCTSTGSQDFEDADLQDSDLVAAEDGAFEDVDELDLTLGDVERPLPTLVENGKQRKPVLPGKKRQDTDNSEWYPTKLANGKWDCKHHCKDKQACKHLCCREGLDKPPKISKVVKKDGDSVKPSSDIKKQKSTMDYYAQSKTGSGSVVSTSHGKNKKKQTPSFPYPDRQVGQNSVSSAEEVSEVFDNYHGLTATSSAVARNDLGTHKEGTGLFLTDTSSPEKEEPEELDLYVQSQFKLPGLRYPGEKAIDLPPTDSSNAKYPQQLIRNGIDDRSRLKFPEIHAFRDWDAEDSADEAATQPKKRRMLEFVTEHEAPRKFVTLSDLEGSMAVSRAPEIVQREGTESEIQDDAQFEDDDFDVDEVEYDILQPRGEPSVIFKGEGNTFAGQKQDYRDAAKAGPTTATTAGASSMNTVPGKSEDEQDVEHGDEVTKNDDDEDGVDDGARAWLMDVFGDLVEFV